MIKKSFAILTSAFLFSILFLGATLLSPKALAACTTDPSWSYLGKTDGVRSVTYHLRLTNNCSGSNNFKIFVSHLPNATTTAEDTVPNASVQDRLHADWRVKQEDGTWGNLNTQIVRSVDGSENIDIRVIRDISFYHPNGLYAFVRFRAELNSNSNINDILKRDYTVQNRPDLIVSSFVYPSGPTCQTVNPTVKIKNIGWVDVSTDFRVTVFNGNADTKNHTVTQRVDHNEEINLSSRFTGMGLPPIGSYTARATVDSNNNVVEEDEGNSRNSNYNTTTCITPPPPSTYTISGGVFLDTGGVTGSKDSDESYTNGNIRITNTATGAVTNTTSVAGTGFTSSPLPAGTYSVTYTNKPADHILTVPSLLTVNVKIGTGCTPAAGGSSCTASNNIINLNFGIRPVASGEKWTQGLGGDMRADNGLDNLIPDSNYFSIGRSTPFMSPGIVFGTDLNLGIADTAQKTSTEKWFVENEKFSFPIIRTKYENMKLTLYNRGVFTPAASIRTTACSGSDPCVLRADLPNGIYKTDNIPPFKENVTISNGSEYTFPADKDFIFMIDGDLKIENNISVPKGSFAIFIVSGNITVAGNVTKIEGIFSTDNNFIVESETPGADEQLIINGSVIGNAGISGGTFDNSRDLVNNDTAPSVKINYRPDFVLNAPELIRTQNYTIKEVAPGSR